MLFIKCIQLLFYHAVIAISCISADICVHGKPCGTQLTQEHIAVFTNEGFTIPADDAVVLYSKVHFRSTGRIAKSKRTFRTGLRNNSGIVFCDQAGRMLWRAIIGCTIYMCESCICNSPPLHSNWRNAQ